MSFTRSSALTFLRGRTRMETSCGFSVSSVSMSFLISGSLARGAATISRLETLSGQIRTCWPAAPCPPAPEGGLEGGGCGEGLEDSITIPGRGPNELEDEEEDGRGMLGALG